MRDVDAVDEYTTGQRIGLIIFILAVVFTAVLVWMGISGRHWPHWLLALTSII